MVERKLAVQILEIYVQGGYPGWAGRLGQREQDEYRRDAFSA